MIDEGIRRERQKFKSEGFKYGRGELRLYKSDLDKK